MNKQEFLARLRKGLSGLPQKDIEERLTFYREMMEDRMEEGLSEEEAVSAAGPVETIVAQIVADIPLTKIAREKIRPKRHLKIWEIILLILGSPIWLSLGIAAAAVILALYLSLWAVIVSLWAVFASVAACAVGSVPVCVAFITGNNGASGIAMLAAGLVCAGLSVFLFCGDRAATKGILTLTGKIATGIKNRLIKREEVS